MTNKGSNIAEDLDTLQLVVRSIPEAVKSLADEEEVRTSAFELVFVLDECVAMGMKQPMQHTNVRGALSMESHEERLHKMIIDSKVSETKDLMKRKANEIDRQKAETGRAATAGPTRPSFEQPPTAAPTATATAAAARSADATVHLPGASPATTAGTNEYAASMRQQQAPAAGMQLGADRGASDILASLQAEGEEVPEGQEASADPNVLDASVAGSAENAAPASPQAPRSRRKGDEQVQIRLDEKLSAQLQADGMLERMEVQGTMTLEVFEEAFNSIQAELELGQSADMFQFKTHPNINKQLFQKDRQIGLKDQSRTFPLNSNLGVLKWRWQGTEESYLPITITCWPSTTNSTTLVSLEYEAQESFDLYSLCISIPLPSPQKTSVSQVDGQTSIDSRRGVLDWTVDIVDQTNANGSLEFTTAQADAEAFFPITVSFTTPSNLCDIDVKSVQRTSDGREPRIDESRSLAADGYRVVSG